MQHYRLFLFFVGILFQQSLFAQPPVNEYTSKDASQLQAIGITDQSKFDQLLMAIPGVGSNSRLIQEQQSLKPYMMPVRKMGFRGADWSYMLASCLEYYVNLKQNFKDNLSPDYISLSLQSLGQKPSIAQGLNFLTQTGTVSAAIVPYDAAQIPQSVYATTKYQINNYLHLFQSFASEREKIFEIRKALMRGHPVLIEIKADANFPSLTNTRVWETPRTLGDYSYTLLLVGYDENTESFELRSSWGSNWANNGYLWVKYNDLANAAVNGYVMVAGN